MSVARLTLPRLRVAPWLLASALLLGLLPHRVLAQRTPAPGVSTSGASTHGAAARAAAVRAAVEHLISRRALANAPCVTRFSVSCQDGVRLVTHAEILPELVSPVHGSDTVEARVVFTLGGVIGMLDGSLMVLPPHAAERDTLIVQLVRSGAEWRAVEPSSAPGVVRTRIATAKDFFHLTTDDLWVLGRAARAQPIHAGHLWSASAQ